ncbi:FxsA family protein [Nocardioides mangrovi]|uniref:FxsA family protein n=1 Tax=Nocardioides mangrovi TaxID=2874580 RepID=A0ABS7UGC7_9ACTN|nr:FxsA family protein [Nocardioides mangrovi]MBZ5739850.1 FxsA family protein [Nocardioides mangrovi]
MRRRTPAVRALLFVLFIVVPLVEIYVLVQVGQVIGAGWTILLLVADALLGTWLMRREGARAWRTLREAVEQGRMPATELADGALILFGGALMLAPGFVTDVFGILLILPFTRPFFRRLLSAFVARRLVVNVTRPGTQGRGPESGPGPVVRGEVVDDD